MKIYTLFLILLLYTSCGFMDTPNRPYHGSVMPTHYCSDPKTLEVQNAINVNAGRASLAAQVGYTIDPKVAISFLGQYNQATKQGYLSVSHRNKYKSNLDIVPYLTLGGGLINGTLRFNQYEDIFDSDIRNRVFVKGNFVYLGSHVEFQTQISDSDKLVPSFGLHMAYINRTSVLIEYDWQQYQPFPMSTYLVPYADASLKYRLGSDKFFTIFELGASVPLLQIDKFSSAFYGSSGYGSIGIQYYLRKRN